MNIYDIPELQKYLNTGFVDYGNTQSGMATNFPFLPVNELPKQITYGSADDVYPPALPGITQSTAAKQFEEPYRIINGQKVYISDVIGTKQAEEKANFFQKPTGIMTQAKDFFTQTVPRTISGIASSAIDFIPGMRFIKSLDRFDTLPYEDRKFIESVMQKDAKGNLTSGIYVDPSTGLLKDMRGKNVRSLMGNYAESIEQGYIDKEKSIEKSKENWNKNYGSLDNTNEYGKTWNEMNKRNINEFNFLTSMKAKFDKQKAELKEKFKKTKSINIHGGDGNKVTTKKSGGEYRGGADFRDANPYGGSGTKGDMGADSFI